jgi:predicted peptidase
MRQLLTSLAALFLSIVSLPAFAQEKKELDPAIANDPQKMFEPRDFADQAGNVLKYRLLKPANYNPNQKYPLVIFLHGAGERGNDNKIQLVHGMKDFLDAERRKSMPCYVLAPQCPAGKKWVEVDWSSDTSTIPEKVSDSLGLTIELVKSMIETAAVDPNRIYITGLSMGGYGTWDALARHPEMFAAAAPICGGGDPSTVARFKNIPLWAFHGDEDKAVKVERTRAMIEALKTAGGEPKYTEYPGVGHDSWTATYKNPEFHQWLFTQRRPKKPGDSVKAAEEASEDKPSEDKPSEEKPSQDK